MFRLALALGRTVDELSENLGYEEFLEWMEYYSFEPFGEWRADVRSGLVASVIANVNRDPTKVPEPYTSEDFMLFNKAKKQQWSEDDEGAHIDPSTIAWLFAKAGASVN